MAIKHWPQGERPREKLLKGLSLSDAELLSILIGCGIQGKSAIDIGRNAFLEFGSWRNLLSASQKDFCRIRGLGVTHYVKVQAAEEIGKRSLHEPMLVNDVITNKRDTSRYLLARMKDYTREVFGCLFLNGANRMIRFQELFFGTINMSPVYTREVVTAALECGAVSVIAAHNHPSGVPKPSKADIHLTRKLKDALALLDIHLLDHLIVGKDAVASLAEQGLL